MKLATLCYVRHEGRTLMLHRVKKARDMHAGKWNGLGGKFEAGESPEDCARREILEESGLEVGRLELKGFLSFPGFQGDDDWYAFVFLAFEPRGDLLDDPAEGHLAWIADAQLTQLPLWAGDHVFLPWLDRPGFFSACFVYQGETLAHHDVQWYGASGEASGQGQILSR